MLKGTGLWMGSHVHGNSLRCGPVGRFRENVISISKRVQWQELTYSTNPRQDAGGVVTAEKTLRPQTTPQVTDGIARLFWREENTPGGY